MENLFVYGTLKIAKIQKEVIGRTPESSEEILFGYCLAQINIQGNFSNIKKIKKHRRHC